METRQHNTSRAALAELARFADRRNETYRKLREEQRRKLLAELAREKEEACKARELRDARRIRKDKVVVVVGVS